MKEDQRVILTKRLLQEGLMTLLEKKDIDEVRVSELCAVSGVNRATFYRHYGQPRDILRDVRRSIIADVQELAEKDRAPENLSRWLEDVCQYFHTHAAMMRMLFKTRTDDEFVACIQSIYNEQFDHLRAYTPVPQDDEALKLATYCYAGGFYYLLRQWITEPIDRTPREVAAVMHRMLTGPAAPRA